MSLACNWCIGLTQVAGIPIMSTNKPTENQWIERIAEAIERDAEQKAQAVEAYTTMLANKGLNMASVLAKAAIKHRQEALNEKQ